MRINKDDIVLIRTGSFKLVNPKTKTKRTARVISVDREGGKVVVEGVNVVKKSVRRNKRSPQGGILRKEMPIPVDNVQLVCPSCGKPTRVGVAFDETGAKFRQCKKCGAKISKIAPPRKKA